MQICLFAITFLQAFNNFCPINIIFSFHPHNDVTRSIFVVTELITSVNPRVFFLLQQHKSVVTLPLYIKQETTIIL